MEVEMKIRGLMMDPVTNMPIVVLKDVNGTAILPIWVGIYEANAIALEIEKVFSRHPGTNVFVLSNHGLVVCGETCDSVQALLDGVERRLEIQPRPAPPPGHGRQRHSPAAR